MSLAGVSWSVRASLTASAIDLRARATAAATRPAALIVSSLDRPRALGRVRRPARGSGRSGRTRGSSPRRARRRSRRRRRRAAPSRGAARRARGARPATLAALTRARSPSNSPRAPSPASSQRRPSSCVSAIAPCAALRLARVEQRLRAPDARRPRPRRRRRRSCRPAVSAAVRSWCRPPCGREHTADLRPARSLRLDSHAATTKERTPQMPTTVILGSARTPIGKLGGAPRAARRDRRSAAIAIAGALERADVEPEQIEHVVMGTVLQAGQGMIPSRQAQDKAGMPVTRQLGDDQQGLRVGHAGGRAARHRDPRRRRRGRPRRRHGVDVERPLPARGRPLRPADGRRHGARRDARATASRARGAASTWRRRRPRSPPSSRSRARTWIAGRCARTSARSPRSTTAGWRRRSSRSRCPRARPTSSSSRTRRRAATRRSRRSRSCRRSSSRTARTPPATRPASTTAPARSSSRASEWAAANGKEPLGDDRRDRAGRRRVPLPRAHAGARGARRAREGRARASQTSTCGRSTRRSPRS